MKTNFRGNAVLGWVIAIGLIWGTSTLISVASSTSHSDKSKSSSQTESVSDYDTEDDYLADNSYKYNSRNGYSGSYEYNYDVSGYGDNGYVDGNIDTENKYGEGYLYDEDGNEIYVETEWVDYGVMEAEDENGNTYELEVD